MTRPGLEDGSDPEYIDDPLGVVPTEAVGEFSATLNLDDNTLYDITLTVDGMSVADLRNFGPNNTPFHLHVPRDGVRGAFGFNVVDLFYGADPAGLVDTQSGFEFTRGPHSILVDAQGAFGGAGVHPGDEVIADLVVDGYAFVLVHSSKDIFTSSGGSLPNGMPAPDGFPFGELRGEIVVVE